MIFHHEEFYKFPDIDQYLKDFDKRKYLPKIPFCGIKTTNERNEHIFALMLNLVKIFVFINNANFYNLFMFTAHVALKCF